MKFFIVHFSTALSSNIEAYPKKGAAPKNVNVETAEIATPTEANILWELDFSSSIMI